MELLHQITLRSLSLTSRPLWTSYQLPVCWPVDNFPNVHWPFTFQVISCHLVLQTLIMETWVKDKWVFLPRCLWFCIGGWEVEAKTQGKRSAVAVFPYLKKQLFKLQWHGTVDMSVHCCCASLPSTCSTCYLHISLVPFFLVLVPQRAGSQRIWPLHDESFHSSKVWPTFGNASWWNVKAASMMILIVLKSFAVLMGWTKELNGRDSGFL